MTKYEIILSGVSLVTTSVASVLAWKLGGKQRASNERADAITAGTDKIVDSSNKLLQRMDEMLVQEQERVKVERDHREMCERELKEQKAMIEELRKEINKLKKV